MLHITRSASLPALHFQSIREEAFQKSMSATDVSSFCIAATKLARNTGLARNTVIDLQPCEEMRIFDLQAAHSLSQDEQWPHRLKDWADVMALGQGLVIKHQDKLIGTGMSWKWGNNHASLGLVIIDKNWRGQGLGQKMMHQLLGRLSNCNVMLHATAIGKPMYEKMGFRETGKLVQHQGVITQPSAMECPTGTSLINASYGNLDELVALDQRAAGMPRKLAIAQLLRQGQAVLLRQKDKSVGFAFRRQFGHGYVIGPVVAPDLSAAKILINHWICASADSFVRLDVHARPEMEQWLSKQNLQPVGGAIAMVRGVAPPRGPEVGGWAVISQSLG